MSLSVHRTLDILNLLLHRQKGATLTEIAKELGIPKSSALLVLKVLEERRFLSTDKHYYLFSEQFRDHGWLTSTTARLIRIAERHMLEAVARTDESVFLGILTSDFEMQYLVKHLGNNEVRYDADISKPRAAYAISSGQLLLAYQEKSALADYLARIHLKPLTPKTITDKNKFLAKLRAIREQQYATNVDEHNVGAAGTAAPILSAAGVPIAAFNITAPSVRFEEKSRLMMKTSIDMANAVSTDLK